MVDGSKLFELANEFGRNVQLGTENNKLKIIITWTNEQQSVMNMANGINQKISESKP